MSDWIDSLSVQNKKRLTALEEKVSILESESWHEVKYNKRLEDLESESHPKEHRGFINILKDYQRHLDILKDRTIRNVERLDKHRERLKQLEAKP